MSTIKANTLLHSDGSTTTQPSIPALDQRMAKAWVSFNGQGTVAIKDSYNVSSITDGGVGDYDVSFTVPMSDANYCTVTNNRAGTHYSGTHYGWNTAAKFKLATYNHSNVNTDSDTVEATVYSN